MDPSQVDVLVLDVNETLSDLDPLRDHFVRVGLPASSLDLWFAMTLRDGFAVTAAGGFASFRDLGVDALRSLLASSGLDADEDVAGSVLAGFAQLPPHADVGPGLRRIHASGVRLVTLTNGATSVSDRLLADAGVIDLLEARISVEEIERWKPHPDSYLFAAQRCRTEPDRMALAAVHPWDVDGARRAGLHGIAVDRRGTPYPSALRRPDLVVRTFEELADWFTGPAQP
jgi:2-haloacid dehalogenase